MRSLCGLVLLAACAAALPGQEPTPQQLLAAIEKQLKAAAATAGPCVATVVVSRSERYPRAANADAPGRLGGFDPREFVKADPSPERAALARALDLSDVRSIPDHGYAGGVVIDAAGLVLTPYHVIDGATKVYVFLPGGGGSYADVHAADSRSDLAVLKLLNPPPKLSAIKFADVRTQRGGGREPTVSTGTLCVLLANPYSSGLKPDGPSAAFGSVSNVRHKFPVPEVGVWAIRPRPTRQTEYGTLLEYDLKLAPGGRGGLNAGLTGGVLLNLDGEMIGLTNAAAVAWGNDVGPGYAVAADDNFKRIVGVLRRGEEVEYGFLWVTMIDESNSMIDPMPGGAAALAGIRRGDKIREVNGLPVTSYHDLLMHVGAGLAGSEVPVAVDRGGVVHQFKVTLGKYLSEQPFVASVRPEPVFGMRVDYRSVLAQKQPLRPPGDVTPAAPFPAGVWVREAADDSPAARQFKTIGDSPGQWLVTSVNGVPVDSPAEFYKAARGQAKVRLSLVDPKDNTRRELTLP